MYTLYMQIPDSLDQALEFIRQQKISTREKERLTRKKDIYFNIHEEVEILEKNIQREKEFYVIMLAKITHAIENWWDKSKKKLLLFDLDHTLVADGESTLRVGGLILLEKLQEKYRDNISIWICSSRSHFGIQAVFDKHPDIFGTEYDYMFSCREYDYIYHKPIELIKQWRWSMSRDQFYFEKVNSLIQIQNDHKDVYPILIDDIIDESFEEKKMGIQVPKNLISVFELEK